MQSQRRKEIIVPVIGMTGAGKSTFINHLFRTEMFPVGMTLVPCTTEFNSATITFDDAELAPYSKIGSKLKDYAFTIVDTPGFDDNKVTNNLILSRLVQYLRKSKKVLGGIIYLHDITKDRISDDAGRLTKLLEDWYSEAMGHKVLFGITKGQRMMDVTAFQDRRHELSTKHWCSMIGKGARILDFKNTRMSALQFLELIVNNRQEILIPVMGPSGAGKSKFINYLLREDQKKMPVGHGTASYTTVLQSATVTFDTPTLANYVVTLLDTPGFDHTHASDADTIRDVTKWLQTSYRKEKILGGVIYLHDISSKRFSNTALQNLQKLISMCGDAGYSRVVIGTTGWQSIEPEVAQSHHSELESVHWNSMTQKGTHVFQFQDNRDSAIKFVEAIVRNMY